MLKRVLVLVIVLLLAAPASSYAYYTVHYHCDFSDGLEGWSVVGGGADIPVQVFSDANPMAVTEVYEDNGIAFRNSDIVAGAVPSTDGNAIGWAATGLYSGQPVQRISRVFAMIPGEYKIDATWKYTAWHQTRGLEQYTVGAAFLALVGDDIGRTDNSSDALFNQPLWDPSSTRNTTWNNSWEGNTNGEWMNRVKYKDNMLSDDGKIEISLGMYDKFGNNPGEYRWAAFDDLDITFTTGLPPCPEPTGIAALLTGIGALGGLALRRKRPDRSM